MHYLTFDPGLLVKVTRNVAKYPLHHVTYSATRFEVATSNSLGGDTFTRNVVDERTHGRTHRWMDRRMDDGQTLVRNQYTFFLKKKNGYNEFN